jgi:hypothetical protein
MGRLLRVAILGLVIAALPAIAQEPPATFSPTSSGQNLFFSPGTLFLGGNSGFDGNPLFGQNAFFGGRRFGFFGGRSFLNPFGFGRHRFRHNRYGYGRNGRYGYGRQLGFGDASMWAGYFGYGYGYGDYMYSVTPQVAPPSNPYPEEYRVKGKLAADVDVLTGKSSRSNANQEYDAPPSEPAPAPPDPDQ